MMLRFQSIALFIIRILRVKPTHSLLVPTTDTEDVEMGDPDRVLSSS